MTKKIVVLVVLISLLALAATTLAIGGSKGLIWDDNHYAKPGSLDDGKDLLPQTKIPLAQAVAAAQHAATGALGQVDLERTSNGRIVYMVDIGDQEVRIDSADGSVYSISARD